MPLDVALNDRQPQAQTCSLTGRVPRPGEPLEDSISTFGGDPGSGVIHDHLHTLLDRRHPDGQAAASVPFGIFDEIRENPLKATLVHQHRQIARCRINRRHLTTRGCVCRLGD
jgi:hypothetical protein